MSNQGPTFLEKLRFFGSLYALTLLPHNPETRPHWNEIIPGLILGGIPIATNVFGHGNHGEKLMNQCKKAGRPLSVVVSAIEPWELEGQGIGIKPVSQDYWKQKGVTPRLIEMQDFTGNANLADIKAEADAIHKARQNGGSAYVHCKAGRGRSFLVVFCYLMLHEKMDANEALKVIYDNRSQVSPSARQFKTIEEFRQRYCPQSKPLNSDSNVFYPYRKDLSSFLSSSKLQGLLTTVASLVIAGSSWGVSLISGFFAKSVSERVQAGQVDYQHNQYLAMLNQVSDDLEISKDKAEAFNAGFEASTDWAAWGRSWLKPSTYYTQYDAFAGGIEAGKEHNNELKEQVSQKAKMS